MRPKLGSAPCSAVFTSGEFATARATGSTCASSPRTTMRATRCVPSPSATISIASWRSTASIASPSTSSSALSGATSTPEAPFASANTVSLVDSWPSTLMRSKERFTVTPVSRSSVSADIAASVCTKQNIVAKRGEIMPAPFACADSRTLPPASCTSRQARLGERSLVMIESEKSPASAPSAAHAVRTPPRSGSRGSSKPITPVDATPTCEASIPSSSAASCWVA